jgi:hypothetical protein
MANSGSSRPPAAVKKITAAAASKSERFANAGDFSAKEFTIIG